MADENHFDETAKWLERLESAKLGDREALGWLLQNYWQPLWDETCTRMGDKLEGVDAKAAIVHETLVDAENSFGEFKGKTPKELRVWLQTILTDSIRDAWRPTDDQRQSDTGIQSKEVMINDDMSPLTSSAACMAHENEAVIEWVMLQMPEHYRTVLRLRHWDGMAFEGIGKLMDKSPDAVRQLWFRSVELFAEILDQHDSK